MPNIDQIKIHRPAIANHLDIAGGRIYKNIEINNTTNLSAESALNASFWGEKMKICQSEA